MLYFLLFENTMTEITVSVPTQENLQILSYWVSASAVTFKETVASSIKENFLIGRSEKIVEKEKIKDVEQQSVSFD